MNRLITFFILLLGISSSAVAQEHALVKGRVIDAETGNVMAGANVALSNQSKGVSTDTAGYFALEKIEPGSYRLLSTFVGYEKMEKNIVLQSGETRTINIRLQPKTYKLNGLVVKTSDPRVEQRNIGQAKVESSFLQNLPAIFEKDLFRSLQLLPGIKSTSELSSGLHIRGGSPDQTLIMFNEATIYNPSHFFGFYSTFNPNIIGDVELYKGTYPAKYGGRLGSVLSIANKNGNRNAVSGNLSLGMLATNTTVEGPINPNKDNGSWMLSVRRSTLEPVLNVLNQSYEDIPNRFYFWDANGRISYNAGANDKLSLTFYSGKDKLNFPFADQTGIKLDYGNQLLSSSWQHTFTDDLATSVTLSGSRYFNFPSFEVATTPYERSNQIHNFAMKTDVEYQPGNRHNILAGIHLENKNIELTDKQDSQSTFTSSHRSLYTALFLQDNWLLSDRVTFSPGVRVTHYRAGEDYYRAEPRLSFEYRPSDDVELQAAYGRYHQYMALVSHEAFSGLDVWMSAGDGVAPSSSNQYSLGIKTDPWQGYRFDTEFYYRSMSDLFEPDPFVPDRSGIPYKDIFRFGRGYAYGAEFIFERNVGKLRGFASYTYSVTRRKFPNVNKPIDRPGTAEFYPTRFNRPHALNLALTYKLNSHWSTSMVFNYSSGRPYTKPVARTFTFQSPISGRGDHQIVTGDINGSRMPAYHRFDISIKRRGTFFGLGQSEFQIQIINLYSRRNTWFYNFDLNKPPSRQRNEVQLLPMLPNISYSINF